MSLCLAITISYILYKHLFLELIYVDSIDFQNPQNYAQIKI